MCDQFDADEGEPPEPPGGPMRRPDPSPRHCSQPHANSETGATNEPRPDASVGELIVAPIWSIPMDIAPRYAGFANGMMNFGFGVAGLVSPSSFGYLVNRTGSWAIPFHWVHCTIALMSGTRNASAAGPKVCRRERVAPGRSGGVLVALWTDMTF